MDSKAFGRFLVELGVRPGVELGTYLRGERSIPENWSAKAQQAGAVFKRPSRDPLSPPKERGLNMQNAFDMFVKAVSRQFRGGVSVSDMYVNVPKGESVDAHVESAAFDMGNSLLYSLEGPAKTWYDRMESAIDSGNYQRDGQRWDLSTLRYLAREALSEAWFEAASSELKAIMRNPTERLRLDALRPDSGW